jgi:flavorubredoxin
MGTMSETRIDEVGDRIYRIHTPVRGGALEGGFSFNQYLVDDDEPLLVHTGGRGIFDAVRAAVERVLPVSKLRFIVFSHIEADEAGSLNKFLDAAPEAKPVCSKIAAMTSINDLADRPPRALGDGETMVTGSRRFLWVDAPHVPHGWENGYLFEATSLTLFCSDLFTQPGTDSRPLTGEDILGPSEAFRTKFDYFSHAPQTQQVLDRLAELNPQTLACMHGSAWRGNGAELLRCLARSIA